MSDSKVTVIVGGGFVGLFTALHLSHLRYPHRIILIDPQSCFDFKPLLYEYLTGEMQSEQVLPRYEDLLHGSNVSFVQDKVIQVDLDKRRVETATGLYYPYQYLVIAVGSAQGYFGTPGAQEHAFAFRTQVDANKLEQHLRSCLQTAAQTRDPAERKKQLSVAVVGAGPSGVEMAATLADLLPQWYDSLGGDFHEIQIHLINHGQEILEGDINSHLREIAVKALQQRTVSVQYLLGVKVTAVSRDQITYQAQGQPEENLATATTVWTAGTATNPLLNQLALPDDHRSQHGLLEVAATLQIPDFPEVFAAGDCAVVQSRSLPAVAQVAYQQGKGIAENLLALTQGKSPQPVSVNLRGTLMKLGIRNGIADLFGKIQINGQTGDIIRSTTYLELLPTPLHDFKATAEWIQDRIFHHYNQLEADVASSETASTASQRNALRPALLWMGGGLIIAVLFILGVIVAQRSMQLPPSTPPSQEQSE